MSVWNPENVADVAESVGLGVLTDDVKDILARDTEFRVSALLVEARKSMRHSKRRKLTSPDISHSLHVQDMEPLFGYNSTRKLLFGEATIGPNQPLFYLEDEEVDFEKLINAPLPKVPRETTFTNHWTAVEGVQPAIPENPIGDSRQLDIGASARSVGNLLAAAIATDVSGSKPLVKHVLSQELQTYFNKAVRAILDQGNAHHQSAAYSSIGTDPGLHQLVPYFVQFVAEKVTHGLKDLFVLRQMMRLVLAMTRNLHLHLDPYAVSLVPPVLTCLIGRRLGDGLNDQDGQYELRDLAATLVGQIARKFARKSETLQQRLIRSCLKCFLDPDKSAGSHYGAILGIFEIGGQEAVRLLIVPSLKEFESVVAVYPKLDGVRIQPSDRVVGAIVTTLRSMRSGRTGRETHNDVAESLESELEDKIGSLFAARVMQEGGRETALQVIGRPI